MREDIAAFLASTGWTGADIRPIAGDLSTRSYHRLTKDGATAILMDCGPDDPSLPKFIAIADWLRALGLSAPEIFAHDCTTGIALIEDFGDAKLTTLIARNPTLQKPAYEQIVDTLITVRNADAPQDLSTPTAQDFAASTDLADTWYPGADTGALMTVRAHLETVLQGILSTTPTLSLRDFHADNVIWLPDRPTAARAGLLDFQDAILTHPAYDLMSLLTDARTDVAPDLRDHITRLYCGRTGDDLDETTRAIAALGVVRNLRILGIFAAAARRDGKPHHLGAMPRVYRHLMDCAAHPTLSTLRAPLTRAIPAPDAALIAELAP